MPTKKDSENETDDQQKRPEPFTPDVAKRKIRLILRDGDTFFSQHLLDDIRTGRHGRERIKTFCTFSKPVKF